MTVKSCEKVEKSQVALTIEVNAAEFEAAVEKAYQKMRRKISVPGFRPGKAPRKMIERMYGAEVFFEEAINIAFPEAYEAAAEQEKLQIVGYPTVEMVGEVTKDGFTFKATTPVYPEVTLGEYKGLKAEKPEVKVLAADVDERLKALADRNTRLVSVDRAAKSGDTAVIDSKGFLEGKPFTEADFRSGMPVAVIARSLAKRLYGEGSAVGQTLSLDFTSFRVVGVVDDVSYLMDRVFSQVWYPYTQVPDFEERVRYSEVRMPGLGPLKVYMLVKDKADIGKVREAVADNVRRFNQSLNVDGKREFSLLGQPDRHWESIFRYWSNVEPDIVGDLSRYGVIFLLLLLVPAVSLSGMADSRMERRLGELGVRRAFGAPKGALIGQVLMENFLYTLLGGLVGLLFSFLLVTFASSWVFKIGNGFSDAAPDGVDVSLSMGMLFNPWVFLIALCVCSLLNLMSALWPAWRASRRPIVDSLNA